MYLTRKMFRIGPGNLMCNACWLLDKTGFRIRLFLQAHQLAQLLSCYLLSTV